MSSFIYALNNADVIRVDDGPLLTGYEYDHDDEMVTFRWVDEDNRFEVIVPRESVATAEHKANGFLVVDADGETVKVEVFSLVPEYPVPPDIREGWLRVFHMADKEKVLYYAALHDVMNNLLDDFIGGHAGSKAKYGGYFSQIEALYNACRGRPGAIVCSLSRRLSSLTPYTKAAWELVLLQPEIQESLAGTLKQYTEATKT